MERDFFLEDLTQEWLEASCAGLVMVEETAAHSEMEKPFAR